MSEGRALQTKCSGTCDAGAAEHLSWSSARRVCFSSLNCEIKKVLITCASLLFAGSSGVSWEEWWTYDGISGEWNGKSCPTALMQFCDCLLPGQVRCLYLFLSFCLDPRSVRLTAEFNFVLLESFGLLNEITLRPDPGSWIFTRERDLTKCFSCA